MTPVEALATQIRRLDVSRVVIIGGDPLKAQALRDKLATDGMHQALGRHNQFSSLQAHVRSRHGAPAYTHR
ncbi:hypothetical protein [Cupriavidus sp. CuC1]|uniref:hypothetical protein n=1 Tax=Cupriavidus sp. CuC1 TaxID=3373131 RepID=UPI0037D8A817